MDAITQVQGYVHALSTLFTHTIEHLRFNAPPVPLEAAKEPYPLESVEEKARLILKRIAEADVLMASLPPVCDEREQLAVIEALEKENKEAGERLAKAQAEAVLWQQRVSAVLQAASHHALATRSEQSSALLELSQQLQQLQQRLGSGVVKMETTEEDGKAPQ